MVDTIAELASLSKTLNKKSDSLNATISSINKKLEALNFGMNIMLSEPSIEYEGNRYYLTYGKYSAPNEKGVHVAGSEEWQLGVYHDAWRSEDALLRAPREVRIRALDFIPLLLDAMKEKAAELIDSIEKAERLAENL